MQQITSTPPDRVLQPGSTHTAPSPLSQETYEREQIIKFFIGLEMLGEKKKERFLLYLLSLQKPNRETQEKKTNEL